VRKLATFVTLLMLTTAGRAEEPYMCFSTDVDGTFPLANGDEVRFATFNSFLNRFAPNALINDLGNPANPQIRAVAEIIQRVRPDVLLLNEFDFDAGGAAVNLFQQNFLGVSQNGQPPIAYPHVFLAESNTGIPSGLDFSNNDMNRDGNPTNDSEDAYGFGAFPGQFAMVLLSKYPIDRNRARTFQKFLWRDMPNALLPDDPATGTPADWYSPQELAAFRLSSKSHWDIPILVDGFAVHVLAAHPTPPVFDDPPSFPAGVDFNGRRNHDEIRFWADYVSGYHASRYIRDDKGRRGGLVFAPFVILGDYNADPNDGDSVDVAIQQLLDHPDIDATVAPASFGGIEDAARSGGANALHTGHPALDTGDFNPTAPGNLRADYVLPSKRGLEPVCGGVFWPTSTDSTFPLVGNGFPVVSSDHHLVWLDIRVKPLDLLDN
jgi:3-phytase